LHSKVTPKAFLDAQKRRWFPVKTYSQKDKEKKNNRGSCVALLA
jgi:hypothetical protein